MDEVHKALAETVRLRIKAKAVELNWGVCKAGFEFAEKTFTQVRVPYGVERMNATAGKIIIDGNALALWAACLPGVTVVTCCIPSHRHRLWWETLIGYMKPLPSDDRNWQGHLIRHCAGGRRTGFHRYGAGRRGWAGARSYDRHGRPGISLMSEFI